ncbi:transporter substrate-binding domain-containing protein [Rhizobium beringeri]
MPALLANRVQIGISSLTITQERLKSLAFAQPYYDSDQSLTTLASSGINELDALKGQEDRRGFGRDIRYLGDGAQRQYAFEASTVTMP